MATPKPLSRQALDLADRLVDGRLTDAEVAQLDELLAGNADLQQHLLELCQFHALLHFDSRAQRLIDRVVSHRSGESVAPQPQARRPVLRRGLRKESHRSLLRVAGASLAASLLVALVTLALLDMTRPRVDMGPIARADDDNPLQLPEVTAVRVGPHTTELELASIGSVVLDGPSDFELIGPMRARLTKGKIKFRVTDERGHGFVVETPYGEITDLGTEFGIDVEELESTSLVVFEGEVDLRIPNGASLQSPPTAAQRLIGGEGVVIDRDGKVDRLMSIFTGDSATFSCNRGIGGDQPVITAVRDNLRSSDTRNYYEIVPQGMREDALAYVDRPAHEWNGVDENGMPPYLKGADYIKPFNNDKTRTNFQLEVELSVAAHLYIFYDDRIEPPQWLLEDFEDTGDDVAIDVGPWRDVNGLEHQSRRGYGPGQWVDNVFSVWRRKSTDPGKVVLGGNAGTSSLTAMYGICAKATGRDQ